MKSLEYQLSLAPFSMRISALELDSKSDYELQQLLTRVVSVVDPSWSSPDVENLLMLLDCPADVRADRIRSLVWVCENHGFIRTAVRIYKLCEKLEIPDDIFFNRENTVSSFVGRVATSQSELRFLYKEWLGNERRCNQIDIVRLEIDSLLSDKRTLKEKVDATRKRMNTVEDFDIVLTYVQTSRKLDQQISLLNQKETELDSAIRHLRNSLQKQSAELEILEEVLKDPEALAKQTQRTASKLLDELGHLETIRDRLDQLEAHSGVTETELAKLEHEISEVQSTVERMSSELQSAENSAQGNEKMLLYYQQYRVARERMDEARSMLEEAEVRRTRSLNRLRKEETEFEDRNGSRFISENELSDFVKLVREKGVEYKRCKKILLELNAELQVLSNTNAILTKDLEDLSPLLSEPAESLIDINAAATRLNKEKESALEEISNVVKELSKKLNGKRAIIGPKLLELKRKREEVESLRSAVNDRRVAVDRELAPIKALISEMKSEYDENITKLERLKDDCDQIETQIERIKYLADVDDVYTEIQETEATLRERGEEHWLLNNKFSDLTKTGGKSIEEKRRDFKTVECMLTRIISS